MMSEKDIPEGDGKIIEDGGKQVAVFNDGGSLKIFSAICPHMGCEVEWNSDERIWDCPCHGSSFEATGELIKGPAKRGLDKV